MNQNRKSGAENMNDQEFDHFFKTQLEHQEVTPDPSNWTKINRWSPLDFRLSILFSKKVMQSAAILLFLLSATTLIFKFGSNIQNNPVSETTTMSATTIAVEDSIQDQTIARSSDFVLDMTVKTETSSDVKKEIIDQELDEYLAFLLGDEDEFAGIIDSQEILKSLMPAEQLPIEEMFAVIPQLPAQEEITILAPLETRITIPHRFIGKDEKIEDLLLLYEINQLRD